MPLGSAFAIYFVFWWIALFAVLPFGVRTHEEAGTAPVPGQADSAPERTHWWPKIAWTTLVSGVLFCLFLANYLHEWLTVADILGR